jgi:thiol-disulfide isomerase/thioredoxin
MFNARKSWSAACLLVLGCLLLLFSGVRIDAGEKKKEADKDVVFSKTEELTDKDEMDTKLKNSYCKVYKVKLSEGKAYRIDLASKAFDTFLRVENAAGKELAFHDDIDYPTNTNSRLIFQAPKTEEYRIIATSFTPKAVGEFTLDVKNASAAEVAQVRLFERVAKTGALAADERKQLVQDVTKHLEGKAGKFSSADINLAHLLTYPLENSDIPLAMETQRSLGKLFAAATDSKIAKTAQPFTMIGNELKIAGKTVDGKDFDLKNLKGKVVLVDFWATWCGPCVAEIPNIRKVHEKYHGKGFDVIGVSLDRTDDAITKFVEDKKLPWNSINIADSGKLAKEYGVNAIPFPVLVDQAGRVVSFRARGPLLERHLERLLAEKK